MNLFGLGNLASERREDTFLFLILLLFFLTPGGTANKGCCDLADDVCGCEGGTEGGFADSYGEYSILILLIILQFLR